MNKILIFALVGVFLLSPFVVIQTTSETNETMSITTNPIVKTEWNKTFGNIYVDERLTSIIQTADNGFALLGSKNDKTWLIKIDTSGNEEWNKTYEGGIGISANLIQTSEGGFLIMGGQIGPNLLIYKTDSLGNIDWNITYNVSPLGSISPIQTNDGNFAFLKQDTNLSLVKINNTGGLLWEKKYNGDIPLKLLESYDQGFFIMSTIDDPYGNYDTWIAKTNSTGHVEWSFSYGGTNSDVMWDAVQTSDNGLVLAGWSKSYGTDGGDAWFVKTNSSGHIEWDNTYQESFHDVAFSVIQLSNGDYLFLGQSDEDLIDTNANDHPWILKTNSAGQELWNFQYTCCIQRSGGNKAIESILTSDGGIVIGGTYQDDIWVAKLKFQEESSTASISIWTPLIALNLLALAIHKKRKK